ncbi:hypothetical protein GXP67_34455 [Rhodocytophaga rosea]|uniref:DUF4595 domain-containing protein n=1 Tax=Rhodocytophaga rosea TaxID=2704465 RepID=A0A6C0GVU0_9BACT|nr:hypothetical protein [Rhodocytophaga rosea]QHT71400.1 hypothetical protein GXP67_34455 [Rhodocytophaga rosea]
MKTILTKAAVYVSALCMTITLPSCELLKDDEDQHPTPTCRISHINTPWDEDIDYAYDSQGLLVTLKKGISLVEETESSTIHLSYDANKQIKEAWDDHDQKIVYEYQGNTLVKTRHYHGPVLIFTRDYVRNGAGAIKEVQIHEGEKEPIFRKYSYTYDWKGNIIQELKYWTFKDSLTLVSTTLYSNYDTKKNVEPWYFLPGTLKMKHNPGIITHISHINNGSKSVNVLTYQYNKEGYPVSLQYKHDNEPAWNYTYQYADCQ